MILLGSYVCYTTNTLDAIEAVIAETYVQLVTTEAKVSATWATTGHPGCLPGTEDEMPHCASIGICGFQEAFPVGNRRVNRRTGAVLSQKQDDDWYHPIAYASHGLKGGESRYHSLKLEFLALKWAVTD